MKKTYDLFMVTVALKKGENSNEVMKALNKLGSLNMSKSIKPDDDCFYALLVEEMDPEIDYTEDFLNEGMLNYLRYVSDRFIDAKFQGQITI